MAIKKPVAKGAKNVSKSQGNSSTLRKNKVTQDEQWILDHVYSGEPCADLSSAEITEAKTRLQVARYKVITAMPYFASAFNAITFMISRELNATMAVDKYWRCYVRPDALIRTPQEHINAVFLHETYHLVLRHAIRAKNHGVNTRTHTIANVAMDMCVNPIVRDNKFTLPNYVVMPSMYGLPEGWSFEQYYDWLMDNVPQLDIDVLLSSGYGVGQGSGSDGIEKDYENNPAKNGGEEYDVPQKGDRVEDIRGNMIREECARKMFEHNSKRPGSVPNEMIVWAEGELKEPRIPWWREFQSCVRGITSRGRMDESYDVRHPQQQVFGKMIVPGMIKYEPVVGINSDTSGSMHGIHDRAMGVVSSALKHIQEVYHVSCDADVHTATKATNVNQIKLVGGGGTDMNRGLAFFAKHNPRPSLVITITDGYCCWNNDEKYPFDHICVLLTKDGTRPEFGKVIVVNPDDFEEFDAD